MKNEPYTVPTWLDGAGNAGLRRGIECSLGQATLERGDPGSGPGNAGLRPGRTAEEAVLERGVHGGDER